MTWPQKLGVDMPPDPNCDLCEGTGTIPCAHCSGSGESLTTFGEPCEACRGKGEVRCPKCQYPEGAPYNEFL